MYPRIPELSAGRGVRSASRARGAPGGSIAHPEDIRRPRKTSVRIPDEILFREELETSATHRGVGLFYVIGRSSDPATAITPESLAAAVPGLVDRDVYICASQRFSAAMRSTLELAGVPKGRVHQEDFAF